MKINVELANKEIIYFEASLLGVEIENGSILNIYSIDGNEKMILGQIREWLYWSWSLYDK